MTEPAKAELGKGQACFGTGCPTQWAELPIP